MTRNSIGAAFGFEDKLWAAADNLQGNMDANCVRLSAESKCKNLSDEGCHGH